MRNGGSAGRHVAGPPPRLQNVPDLYEYQEEYEEDEYEYQDCCCITGLLRRLDLIQQPNDREGDETEKRENHSKSLLDEYLSHQPINYQTILEGACLPSNTFACGKGTCAEKPTRETLGVIDLVINDRTPRFHIGIKMLLRGSRHFLVRRAPLSPPPPPSLSAYRLIRSRFPY
ncbi:hypothetical protein AVEN_187885-1 [Araneus ventricosus]|uniref:Uncharacterized protein n=1 Tax=Araneus ventricosus TaxID=182803 RepID=A0A4Y2CVP1_ARAVE|nr:hypothetical protein AVEN_187885-1 [Araneus ventricosus]